MIRHRRPGGRDARCALFPQACLRQWILGAYLTRPQTGRLISLTERLCACTLGSTSIVRGETKGRWVSVASADNLALVRIHIDLAYAYLSMVNEFEAAGEGYPYNNIPLARRDFAAFVQELQEEEQGIGLPPGIAPQTTYVLVRARATILGEIRFRPQQTPPYCAGHDHVGYNVRPSERRHGHASFMLACVVGEAQERGLPGLALTVAVDNLPSMRLIEKQGGRPATAPDCATATTLYWIPLSLP